MNFALREAIVRILKPNGETAGTGFVLTTDGLIATCSHVVQSSEAQKRGEPKPEKATIVFCATDESREAQVEPDWWRSSHKGEDVAILRVHGGLPEGVKPLPLGSSEGTDNHLFDTFGYPPKSKHGINGDGLILGETAIQNVLVRQLRSTQVTPGFSGAPVVDRLRRRVIGIVTSIAPPDEYGRQGQTAFITPTETLRDICPSLQISDICPYRGLRAFTKDDAAFFFGRETVIVKLLNKLKQEPSFLAVLGPSGSGKSSLVQAGLIPLLRQGKLQGSDHWGVVIIRPANDPFEQLSRQGASSPSRELKAVVQEWFEQNPQQERLVLIIDQFEELFTSCPLELSQIFVDQLAQILDSAESITVILTMRDEFYSHFTQQAPRLVEWLEQGTANVPSTLTQDELSEIVQKPAEALGLNFDTGLIKTIVEDAMDVVFNEQGERVGRSTILPLLEFALTQLWENRRDGFLTHDAYTERVGGVTGGLMNWADRAFRSIEQSQRPLALRILTDLIHLGDEHQGIPDTSRRRQLTSLWRDEDEREAVQQIVQRLVEARLLVTTRDTIEIIHDALLREWGRLRSRLQQDRRFLAWRQGIESRVVGWVKTAPHGIYSRDAGKLLRGGDLIEAEGWLAERLYDLNEAERAFVEESLALRQREETEQEAQRQRELERAQELEQALTRANKELAVSESQRLAFASRFLSTSAPETALLLACEAVQWDPNPLSEDVLRDALDNAPWRVTGFAGHSREVNSAVFSHNGQRILTASDDSTARLWDLHGNCMVIYRHEEKVTSAIFSPDEKRILTTSQDYTARLWHPDGQLIMELPVRNSFFWGRRTIGIFSPDGRYILVCNEDEAWLWDADGNLQPTYWNARPQLDMYRQGQLQEHSYNDPDPYERAERDGHVHRIFTAVFSPDGQQILTASEDKTARIWNLAGQQLTILRGHEGWVVNAVFVPPDGQLILTGSTDKTARLWNSNGELLATLEGHSTDVGHLTFSPDGQLLLTAVDDSITSEGIVRLWDRSGRLLATFEGHKNNEWFRQVAFSPDGQRILAVSNDNTVQIWSLDGRTLAVLRGHLDIIWSAAFSPTSQSILTASKDKMARLWEPTKSLLALIEGHEGAVDSAVYSTDGTHILTSSTDRTTCLWDITGQRKACYNGNANLLTDNVLSPDGRYLLTVEHDTRQVHIWELPPNLRWFDRQAYRDGDQSTTNRVTQPEVQSAADPGEQDIPLVTPRRVSVDPVGPIRWAKYKGRQIRHLARQAILARKSGSFSARVDRRSVPFATFTVSEGTSKGYSGAVGFQKAVFSPDGTRILTLANKCAQLWDRQGKLAATLNGPNLNPSEALTVDFALFSPDSQRVLGGSINGTVWVWTKGGQLITSFLTDDGSAGDNLFSVTFSPDGQRILTTIRRSADLWDLNGHHLSKLPCQTNKVKRGLFSPNGDRILTVAESSIPDVRLWDGDGQLISVLWGAIGGEFAPIRFDRQGKFFCIVDGNIVNVWDHNGSLLATLVTARETQIKQVTFSSDGEHLLLAASDGTAQLWATSDGGTLQSTFKGHTSEVSSAVFSPDGKRVLTASSDGTARQFLVYVDDLLIAAAHRVGRPLDSEEMSRFNIQTPLRFDPKALLVEILIS